MTRTSLAKQFRTNPIEIIIFLGVALVFGKSLHSLVYDDSSAASATRSIASTPSTISAPSTSQTQSSFANIDFICDKAVESETAATKVRLTGPLCGAGTAGMANENGLLKTSVANGANKFVATVFTDLNGGKFSTDYIPLNTGKNPIQVDFTFKDGKSISQTLVIVKN